MRVPRHIEYRRLRNRIRRTLQYGKHTKIDQLSAPMSDFAVDYFHRNSPFDFLTPEFAATISKEGCVDPCTLLMAMVYLDRVKTGARNFFDDSDPADLYLASLLVACKFHEDDGLAEFVYNDEWARSANTSTNHVNHAEISFLTALDWNLLISQQQLQDYLSHMEEWIAKLMITNRGFSTYSDLDVLSRCMANQEFICDCLIKPLLSVLGVASVVYTASVLSVYGVCMSLLVLPQVVPRPGQMPPVSPTRPSLHNGDLFIEMSYNTHIVNENITSSLALPQNETNIGLEFSNVNISACARRLQYPSYHRPGHMPPAPCGRATDQPPLHRTHNPSYRMPTLIGTN